MKLSKEFIMKQVFQPPKTGTLPIHIIGLDSNIPEYKQNYYLQAKPGREKATGLSICGLMNRIYMIMDFQDGIQKAETAEQHYLEGGGVQALNEAMG